MGILIRNREAFERVKEVNAIVFDKTGTLTQGKFGVSQVIALDNNEEELLRLAAAVELNSEHVIAQAIVAYAQKKGLPLPPVTQFKALPGRGAQGVVEGRKILVGGLNLLNEMNIKLENNQIIDLVRKGQTVVLVIEAERLLGAITLSDKIRKESFEAVKKLKARGIKVYMLTGDSSEVAQEVAAQLEIDDFFAQVLPHQKAKKIKLLQEKGYKVAMVGDGINDAPALVSADVGIAIGAGTDVALESADIILVKNNPQDVVKIIDFAQKTYFKMVQNLWWAAGYNIIALPLAAGVLSKWGIVINPAVGALLMSLSTVIVALNSQTLRKYGPKEEKIKEIKYITQDPVCGMEVKEDQAKFKIKKDNQVIYFCSAHCQEEFEKHSEKYLVKIKKQKERPAAETYIHHHHHH
jgi:Cu2+-exporting ATPase